MPRKISKTQIDRLGDRLKKGEITDDDLRLLDQYRGSFGDAHGKVADLLVSELQLQPTARLKSRESISDKLIRESARLSQIQDISGCRLIVPNLINQNQLVESLENLFSKRDTFEKMVIVDRRQTPSHGYRAVHVIVTHVDKKVEIQLRTALQQLWAESSEKFADRHGIAIKYGGGNERIQSLLLKIASMIAKVEDLEQYVHEKTVRVPQQAAMDVRIAREVSHVRIRAERLRIEVFDALSRALN